MFRIIEQLRADGVFTRFVVPLPERTGLTFVIRDAHGEPEFIFYRHETADLSIRAEHLKPAMGRASWALVGTSTWMTRELSRATSRFLDLAERAGAFVMVDLNVRPHLWSDPRAMRSAIAKLIERAVLVKASDADLRALHGGTDDARWLRGLETGRGRTSWLVTRGPGLASAIGDHGETHLPAYRARCVDATGAGDAFIAGSLATLLAARATPGSPSWGDPEVWLAALRAGHMMGKKAISRPGAVAGLHALGRVRAVVDSVRRSGR